MSRTSSDAAGVRREPLVEENRGRPAEREEYGREAEQRSRHNGREAEWFNHIADEFLKPIPEDVLERTAQIVERAEIRRHQCVLDVGTGTGALLPYILSHRPRRLVACDLAEEMLRRARWRFDGKVIFVRSDVVDLSPALGPFDRVFCNAVFGNFYDQDQTMSAIRRLLTPRGKLVISHPMGRGFVRELMRRNPDLVSHELPEEERLDDMCRRLGFRLGLFVDEPDLYLAIAQRAGTAAVRHHRPAA